MAQQQNYTVVLVVMQACLFPALPQLHLVAQPVYNTAFAVA